MVAWLIDIHIRQKRNDREWDRRIEEKYALMAKIRKLQEEMRDNAAR